MEERDDLVGRYRRGDVAAATSMAYSDCSTQSDYGTQEQRRGDNNNNKKERDRERGFTDCLSA